jgi:hypothetical protein
MASIELNPGSHTLTVPITMLPTGQAGSAYVELTSDAAGNNQIAVGTATNFTSTGAAQNIAMPINVPSGGGIYYVWIIVTENGITVGAFPQSSTITVGSVTVGQGAWS